MKKLVSVLALATTISTANAMPTVNQLNPIHPHYNYNYSVGYNHGKHTAYQNVATTLFVVGAIAIAGVVIYHLGEEKSSRWDVNDKGVVYRF